MAATRRSGRSRFPVFVLVLLSVTLLTLDSRDFGPVETLKDGVATVLRPFRSAGDAAFGPVANVWDDFTESDDLRAENAALRAELEAVRAEQISDEGAAEQLEQLRAQLDLQDALQYDTVVAEVVARSVSNFDQLVLEINRGAADGVRDGNPVVSVGGLIGRVEETRQRTSRVRLISDSSVSVGVLVVDADEAGIMTGQGEGEPLRVGNSTIPVDAEIAVGDSVLTSGGDRSPYPPGLPVGTVASIEVNQATLEKILLIEPSASLEHAEFVTVVLFDPDAGAEEADQDEAG